MKTMERILPPSSGLWSADVASRVRARSRRARCYVAAIALVLLPNSLAAEPRQHSFGTVHLRVIAHLASSNAPSAVGVRGVYAGALQADGGFVLGSSTTGELRYFSPRGEYLRSAGKKGHGPGQFERISWVKAIRGDSLLVYDPRSSRFSIVDATGRHGRVFMASSGYNSIPVGLAGTDGLLLVNEDGGFDPHVATGVVRDSMTLLQLSLSGSIVRQLGRFEAGEWLLYRNGGAGAARLELGHHGLIAICSGLVVYGDSHGAKLSVIEPGGARVGELSLGDVSMRTLEPASIDRFLDGYKDDPGALTALRAYYRVGGSIAAPSLAAVYGDTRGRVWVALLPKLPADSVTWRVLTTRGEVVGNASLPYGSTILDILDDTLLVRSVDSHGTEHITVYQISQ